MKRNFFVCLVVFVVALVLALPSFAQEKKDKPKSEKLKNVLIVKAAAPDASGKFSTISIQTDKGTFPVLRNAIAKKMEPYAGSRAELEAMPKEMDGKKVYEVWTFSRTIEGQKPRRLPSE
jgi:PDZ domain-containing secreted protein